VTSKPAAGLSRALVVFHLAETSGPSRSLQAPVRRLAERAAVEVVVPAAGPVEACYAQWCRVGATPFEALTLRGGAGALARRARNGWRDVAHFRALIRRERPDVVVQATAMLPALAAAAQLEKVPLVVYAGELFGGEGARRAGAAALVAYTGRAASEVVACSAAVARQYAGCDARVETMLGPVTPAANPGSRDASRQAWEIEARDACVVSVGSLSAGRGQDVLVRAMARVRAEHPRARCLIFGKPHPRPQDLDYAASLRASIEGLGLDGTVRLCGGVDDAAGAYAAADIVVNPARIEAFGRVPFEAALAGRPTVATDIPGARDYLRDGENSLLVPPGDEERLAGAIGRLLSDPGLGKRLAGAAATFARDELGEERAAGRFLAAVERAAGGR